MTLPKLATTQNSKTVYDWIFENGIHQPTFQILLQREAQRNLSEVTANPEMQKTTGQGSKQDKSEIQTGTQLLIYQVYTEEPKCSKNERASVLEKMSSFK